MIDPTTSMSDSDRRALLIADGLDAVAEWESEHGSFSESELAAARRRIANELEHISAT